MRNTSRRIKAGCKSRSKIFETRDELLAVELSELLNGAQGVLRYLDHCASIMNIHNKTSVKAFVNARRREGLDEADQEWARANRRRVLLSAQALYQDLFPVVGLKIGRSSRPFVIGATKHRHMRSSLLKSKASCPWWRKENQEAF